MKFMHQLEDIRSKGEPISGNGRLPLLLLATLALLCTSPGHVLAQQFPDRPLRLVIPYPPSGATDIIGRVVGNKVSEYLGQPVLVDNRPGANTTIGAMIVAKANPDGHSLLFASLSTMALNPATYKKLPYDPIKDFAPVVKLSGYANYLVARNGFAPRSVPELVAYAKANPGKVTYGSTGNGSPAHFGGVMLEQLAGIKMVHVPYQGNAQSHNDMMGERLDINLPGLPSIEALVRAGKMRMLAYAGSKREPKYPDLPTVAEAGYPDYWVGTWYAIVTKSGTPRAHILKLNREFNRALQSPEVVKTLVSGGAEVGGGTPEELAALIRKEIPRWAKIAKAGGISFD